MEVRLYLRVAAIVLVVFSVSTFCGCAGRRPPGPILWQQQEAALHDPYPDNDLGPEVVGGRPHQFQEPMPEPVRSRRFFESLWTP